jgi:predicted amidophosphoribosyltransferase
MKNNNICILCSKFIPNENDLLFNVCFDCKLLLEEQFFNNIFSKSCPICCLPTLSGDSCVNCSKLGQSVIDIKQTCFLYTGIVKELITYYKFKNIIQLSTVFSHYILRALGNINNHILLIPIPGNPKNLKKRGWDQVLEITKSIRHDNFSVHVLLKQKKRHKQQKSLDKSQRIIQAKNKFFIDRKILKNVIEELHTFEQYKVVLLDDIITTGATLESAATIIIKTLKVPIHAITLAMD